VPTALAQAGQASRSGVEGLLAMTLASPF